MTRKSATRVGMRGELGQNVRVQIRPLLRCSLAQLWTTDLSSLRNLQNETPLTRESLCQSNRVTHEALLSVSFREGVPVSVYTYEWELASRCIRQLFPDGRRSDSFLDSAVGLSCLRRPCRAGLGILHLTREHNGEALGLPADSPGLKPSSDTR